MSALVFTPSREGSVQMVTLAGRLDSLTAPEFELGMADLAVTNIVLDLSGLTYISSAGLHCVLGALKRASAHGGKLAIVAPIPSVLEIFEISGFLTLVKVHPDRASAVAALD